MKIKKTSMFFRAAIVLILPMLLTSLAGNDAKAQSDPSQPAQAANKTVIKTEDDLNRLKKEIESNSSIPSDKKQEIIARAEKLFREYQERNQIIQGDSSSAQVQTDPNLVNCFDYYKFGSVKVALSTENYNGFAGQEMKFNAELVNENNYPLVDGNLWIQILRKNPEGEQANGHNLVDQFLAKDNISLQPLGKQKISFSYKIPEGFSKDIYYAAAFFTVAKSYNLSGLTFLSNVYAGYGSFELDGAQKKPVYLDRNSVKVSGKEYKFRSLVEPLPQDQDVKIDFPLVNARGAKENVLVKYQLFSWDTLKESNLIKTSEEGVSLNPGESKSLRYVIPKIAPGTYQLRITAESKSAKSMLEIRLTTTNVQKGRINFAALDKFPLADGDKYTVFTCFHNAGGGTVPGAKVELTVKDEKGKVVARKDYSGDVSGGIQAIKNESSSKDDYNYLVLTATIKDASGKIMDEVTTIYDTRGGAGGEAASAKTSKEKGHSFFTYILLTILVLLVAGLTVFWRSKRKKGGNGGAKISIWLLGFLLGASLMFVFSSEKAWAIAGDFGTCPDNSDWGTETGQYQSSVSNNTFQTKMKVGTGIGRACANVSGSVALDSNCLFKKNGLCLPSGSTVIIGDILTLNAQQVGEWFMAGAAEDSPPFSQDWVPLVSGGVDFGSWDWPVFVRSFIDSDNVSLSAPSNGRVSINGTQVTALAAGNVPIHMQANFNIKSGLRRGNYNETTLRVLGTSLFGGCPGIGEVCVTTGTGETYCDEYSHCWVDYLVETCSPCMPRYNEIESSAVHIADNQTYILNIIAPDSCQTLNVTANPASINVGGTSNLAVSCADGTPVPLPVSWASGNTGVVTVFDSSSAVNVATAVGAGSTNITATAGNGATGSTALAVTAVPPSNCQSLNVTADPTSISVGGTSDLAVSCADGTPVPLPVSWTSNPAVATMGASSNATNTATGVGAGSTNINAMANNGKTGSTPLVVVAAGGSISGQCKTPPNNRSYCPPNAPPSSSSELCDVYDPSRPPVRSGSGPWSWTCYGQGGGPDMLCNAYVDTPADGQCGTLNGKSLCSEDCPPDDHPDLCQSSANPRNLSPSSLDDFCKPDYYEVTWDCPGSCGGSTASCSARGKKACGWIETNP